MSAAFWQGYWTVFVVLFGAVIGSFLNVCIYRIPREESIVRPRSRCPRCGAAIAWYDNIPILSWLLLRGRCRRCAGRISPRYLLVETLTALLFVAVWLRYGWDLRTVIYWLFVAGLILGTFVDLDHLIIPDRVTLGGMAAGLALSAAAPALHGAVSWLDGLSRSVLGMAVGLGSLWLVAELGRRAFKKEAMGLGDVKLLGAIGAFLGWRAVLFCLVISSLTGSVVGLYLIFRLGREWQSRIPYGPYLALAAVLWILGGDGWWGAYMNWVLPPAP